MAERALRPLLPAPPGFRSKSPDDEQPESSAKASILAACATCRARKKRCDGKRPSCTSCTRRQDTCMYETSGRETHNQALKRKFHHLEKQQHTYKSVFEAIQTRSDQEALEIVRRIRSGDDLGNIVEQMANGDLLLQLSLIPETRYRYEFPFKAKMPAILNSPGNRYLNSPLYDLAPSDAPRPRLTNVTTGSPSETYGPYLKPFHAAEFVDALLSSAEPSKWTTVSSNDNLLRKLLGLYFRQEHLFLAFVHKDYFLEDMNNGHERFCSSLLVNAMLAYACVSFRGFPDRAQFWNPNNLGYRFLAEAKRLWEESPNKRKLTSIQAALFLHATIGSSGADGLGFVIYVKPAVSLAKEMKLFEPIKSEMEPKLRTVRTFTAWTLFMWQSHCCYHYNTAPLVEKPPATPLPDPREDPDWFGQIWLKYPLDQPLYSANFELFFKAFSEFRVLMHEVSLRYFGRSNSWTEPTMETAAGFYHRLQAWFHALPEPLSPERIVFPCQFKLHMQYHFMIINIFQGALSQKSETSIDTEASLFSGTNPADILSEAKIRLETLLRLYYLRHGFEEFDLYLIAVLNLVFYYSVERGKESSHGSAASHDDHSSTVILCAKGAHDQGQNHFLGQTVLLILRDLMSEKDLSLLHQYINVPSNTTREVISRSSNIQSMWPSGTTSITSDPEQHILNRLLEQYVGLSLEDSNSDTTGESTP